VSDYRIFVCGRCRQHDYFEEHGEQWRGIPPGIRWENLTDDWDCPFCGAPKAAFIHIAGGRAAPTRPRTWWQRLFS
jgi:rubredoxin